MLAVNYYRWEAVNGNAGYVYALDDDEAKIKVETLFDVVVSDMKLVAKGVSVERIRRK